MTAVAVVVVDGTLRRRKVATEAGVQSHRSFFETPAFWLCTKEAAVARSEK